MRIRVREHGGFVFIAPNVQEIFETAPPFDPPATPPTPPPWQNVSERRRSGQNTTCDTCGEFWEFIPLSRVVEFGNFNFQYVPMIACGCGIVGPLRAIPELSDRNFNIVDVGGNKHIYIYKKVKKLELLGRLRGRGIMVSTQAVKKGSPVHTNNPKCKNSIKELGRANGDAYLLGNRDISVTKTFSMYCERCDCYYGYIPNPKKLWANLNGVFSGADRIKRNIHDFGVCFDLFNDLSEVEKELFANSRSSPIMQQALQSYIMDGPNALLVNGITDWVSRNKPARVDRETDMPPRPRWQSAPTHDLERR